MWRFLVKKKGKMIKKNFVIFEVSSNKKRLSLTNQNTELGVFIPGHMPGAPNENIVQNHLNIALLNVF